MKVSSLKLSLQQSIYRSVLSISFLINRRYLSTTILDYLTNLLIPVAFLLLFAFVPISDKYFLQTDEIAAVNGDEACTFISVISDQQYRQPIKNMLLGFYRNFSANIYPIELKAFEFIYNNPDEFVLVKKCRWSYFLNVEFEFNKTFIHLALNYVIFGKKDELTLFDRRMHFDLNSKIGRQKTERIGVETFMNDVMIDQILKLALYNQTIPFRFRFFPMQSDIRDVYTRHCGLTVRMHFLLIAFSLAYVRMVFSIQFDIKTKFLPTIAMRGIGMVRYLFAYFLWTLVTAHFWLVLSACLIIVLEIKFHYSVTLFVSLLSGHLLLSYDLLITAAILLALMKQNEPTLVTFALYLVVYNLAIFFVDPSISPSYLQDPQFWFAMRIVLAIVPGVLFEWLLFELIENFSVEKFELYQQYAPDRVTNYSAIVLLLYYLFVILVKTVLCGLLFRRLIGSDKQNLPTFKLSDKTPSVSSGKKDDHRTTTTTTKNTTTTAEASCDVQTTNSRTESNQNTVLLKFRKVSIAKDSVKIESLDMNICSNEITILFELNDDPSLEVICKLCCGLYKPDSGDVKVGFLPVDYRKNRNKQSTTKVAKVALILTKNFQLNSLTIEEYLHFFGALQGITNPVQLNSIISEALSVLGLGFQRTTRTENLSNIEQTKLAIAISMISDVNVFIMNNPTQSMLLEEKRDFWDVLIRLKLIRTIFLTSTSMDEVDYIGDKVYLFQKSTITYHGTPKQLKDIRREKFCLKISKLSELNKSEIDSLLTRAFPKIVTLKVSLNEYHYAFNCQSDEEMNSVIKLIDILQQKMVGDRNGTGSGQIVVNSIAMITMEDVIQEVFGQKQQQQQEKQNVPSDQQPTTTDDSTSIPVDAARTWPPVPPHFKLRLPNSLSTFNAMMFKGFSVYGHRPLLIVPILLIIFFSDIYWCLMINYIRRHNDDYHTTTESMNQMISIGLSAGQPPSWHLDTGIGNITDSIGDNQTQIFDYHIDTQNVPDPISANQSSALKHFCHNYPHCEILHSNQSYKHWIYRGVRSFHEFAYRYIYFYRFSGPDWSTQSKPTSTNTASMSWLEWLSQSRTNQSDPNMIIVYYNPYTKMNKVYGINYLLPRLVSYHFPNVTMNFHMEQFGRYAEEMNIFEIFLAFFVTCTVQMFLFLYVVFMLYVSRRKEPERQFYLYLTANGISATFYWLTCCIFAFLITVFCYLIVCLFNGLVTMVEVYWEYLTSYLIYFYSYCLYGAVGIVFASMNILYSQNYYRLILILSLMFLTKYLSTMLTYSSWEVNPWLYWLINQIVMIWPPVSLSTLIEMFLIKTYGLSSVLANSSNHNLKLHYQFIWDGAMHLMTIRLLAFIAISIFICSKNQYWSYLWFKWFDQKKVVMRTSFNKDHCVIDENYHIEQMIKRNTLSGNILVVNNISKFSNAKMLDGISFAVAPQQCFGILGLCGAGKSELLRILTGQSPFNEGNFYLKNIDNLTESGPPIKTLPGIGYCPQFSCVNRHLTGLDMMLLMAKIRQVPRENQMAEIEWLSKTFQIDTVLDVLCSRMNEPDKRKLTLAQTFVGNPILVFIDEPTHGFDFMIKRDIWESLRLVRDRYRSTIVLATNLISEVEACCDRVGIMIKGGIRYIGTEQKLRKRFCKGGRSEKAQEEEGILLYLKIKPSMFRDMKYAIQLRKKIQTELPQARLTVSHKYILNYYIDSRNRDNHANNNNHNNNNSHESNLWSTVFSKLEHIRKQFELETFTMTIASLDQMFYVYSKKYHDLV